MTKNWEKQFDEKFTDKFGNTTKILVWKKRRLSRIIPDPGAIKQFISDLLKAEREKGFIAGSELTGRLATEERAKLVEKIEKKASKLYCTAEHLGYHNKDCDGMCEKHGLQRAIKLIKGEKQ